MKRNTEYHNWLIRQGIRDWYKYRKCFPGVANWSGRWPSGTGPSRVLTVVVAILGIEDCQLVAGVLRELLVKYALCGSDMKGTAARPWCHGISCRREDGNSFFGKSAKFVSGTTTTTGIANCHPDRDVGLRSGLNFSIFVCSLSIDRNTNDHNSIRLSHHKPKSTLLETSASPNSECATWHLN